MGISKEDLVLYALSLLEADERPKVNFSKENLAYALDISILTLDLYFTHLKNNGFIIRHKKKYYDDLRQTIETTPEGKKEIEKIQKEIDLEILTPERHNIYSTIKIVTIMKRIDDVLEKIFFLSLFTRLKRFDLPFFFETLKTAKQESNMVKVLSDIEQTGEDQEEVPVVEMFFKTKLYGNNDLEEFEKESFAGTNVNSLLIVAEASIRQARYNQARTIYEYILSPRLKTNQNQWFMARTGLALVTNKTGDMESALAQLDDLMTKVDNKIQKAYCKQIMARIISTTEDHEKALSLFHSVIRSFNALGIPLLLCMAYNNIGVLYFRMEEHEEAERSWKKARRCARDIHSKFFEAIVNTNLADTAMLKGDIDKCKRYLDDAIARFQEISDYEGRAYVDLNYAFYYLEMKDLESAKEHFERALKIAYPFPSPRERKEMKNVFIERAAKNGFNEDVLRADEFLNVLLFG